MNELLHMAIRWISLVLIAAILAAEGVFIFDRCFYGPLNVLDWSGRVMTLDEKQELLAEIGVAPASTDVEFAGLVRSVSDPRRICGLFRAKSRSGVWGGWNQFAISYGTYITGLIGLHHASADPPERVVYQRDGKIRELTPRDFVQCEPADPCEMCFGAPPDHGYSNRAKIRQ